MIPRIGVDLEPGLQLVRSLPELDLLDVAYGATRGGASAIMVPISAFLGANAQSPDLYHRSGLPLFVIKCEVEDLDRVPALGTAPDRVLITGDRGKTVTDIGRVADLSARISSSGQETAILVEPEPAIIREASRAKLRWVVFPTDSASGANSHDAAAAELARIQSAALAASKSNLRVALFGPMGRQLPSSFAEIPALEEVFPSPDLWSLALRLGWENAVVEFRNLMR